MSQKAMGLFRQGFAVCCAHNFFALGEKFHTCSLIRILRQVHAPAQNDSDFVFRLYEKFCEAFYIL